MGEAITGRGRRRKRKGDRHPPHARPPLNFSAAVAPVVHARVRSVDCALYVHTDACDAATSSRASASSCQACDDTLNR